MSRGRTRRGRHMIDKGEISSDLIRAADHEADLLGHPYVGLEHMELARFGSRATHPSGADYSQRYQARSVIGGGRSVAAVPPCVALGRAETDAARRAAEAQERSRADG